VKKLEAAVGDLVQHTQTLKPLHYSLKGQIEETLKLLRNHLAKEDKSPSSNFVRILLEDYLKKVLQDRMGPKEGG